MKIINILPFLILVLLHSACANAQQKENQSTESTPTEKRSTDVKTLKITTLSTMLANQGIGEWGYSALIEVDGKKILFDTGRKPETVLKNAEELGIDLSDVEDVFLSHNHGDHTGGLVTLRREMKKINPKALSKVHVGEGIFAQRVNARNRMMEIKEELEADGVTFEVYKEQHELFPGVWITGPIQRIHEEKNYGGRWKILTENGSVPDNIPEDQSLIIDTDQGFVMVAGCGHAGMINTIEHIRSKIHQEKVFAAIGGFHLVTASDEHLEWTAKKLHEFGVSKIIGAHCTGINALQMLKTLMKLKRSDAVVGSVGDSFDLVNGIKPGIIAN